MPARRIGVLLGFAAALAVGVALRLSTRDQLTAGGRMLVFSSDDAYHMRRARFAVAHFPRTILFDPLMNFPEGGVPIWPPLFDLALAAPSRVLHGAGADARAIAVEAAWVPLVIGAAAVALAGLVGRTVFGGAGGVAAAFFVAICPGHILWTQFGHTDQHVAESATGLLALWAFLACRARADAEAEGRSSPGSARKDAAREALVGLALALAVLSWQGAIYWGAIFALALFLESLVFGRDVFRAALLTLALPAAITAFATAAWLGPIRSPMTYVSFGFFQPLFLAALAAGTVLLETLVEGWRGSARGGKLGARLLFLLAAAAVLVPFSTGLVRGLANGVGYVLGRTQESAGAGGYISYPAGWLQGIFEARPLLADGPGTALQQLSGFFFLAPIVVAVWVVRAAEGPRRGLHLALAIWGAITIFLALSQRLNVYYAAPLAAFCVIEISGAIDRRLRPSGRGLAAAGVAAAAGLLLFPMAAGLRHELSANRASGSDLADTFDWMRRQLPHPVAAYDPRLLDTPPGPPELSRAVSVLAPWSLGHRILLDAELPVVANNFGYGFLDSIRFFLAEGEDEALEIAARRRTRWVLATDLAARMNDYAGYVGRPASLTPGGAPTAAYFRTIQSRLYDFDGRGGEAGGLAVAPLPHFRLLYHSRSAVRRGDGWVARWKVFEITP